MVSALNLNRANIWAGENRLMVKAVTCLIIFYGYLVSGCATSPGKPEPEPYPAGISADIITGQIASTEERLSQIPERQPGNQEKAALLLRLAMLYAHPDNPSCDFALAIDYLKQYAAFGEPVDVEFALSLLTRLSDAIIAGKTACAELTSRNKKLEERLQEISRENLQLKQIIEKLKHLDIQLEKKRKSFD